MAIDLTLCVVPSQVAAIFSKAAEDLDYAEWVSFVPAMLKDPAFRDHGLRAVKELQADVHHLKRFFQFTDDCYFYDTARCSSTLDYLLDSYVRKQQLALAPQPLWEGGAIISAKIAGGQGIPVRLYDREAITTIYELLTPIDPEELLALYDYQAPQEAGVYKATHPDNKEVLLYAFYAIEELFDIAYNDENLLVIKELD